MNMYLHKGKHVFVEQKKKHDFMLFLLKFFDMSD
jgi:hypothetical protein